MAKMKSPFARVVSPYTRAVLDLMSRLDEPGKRRLVGCLEGFVDGYAPYNTTAKVIPFVAGNAVKVVRKGGTV